MPTIYVNIGSNSGDRHALIEQAVAAIASAYPEAVIRRSDYIETEPWGFESPNMFLNLGLAIDLPPTYPDLPEFPSSPACNLRRLIERGSSTDGSLPNLNTSAMEGCKDENTISQLSGRFSDGDGASAGTEEALTDGPVVEFALGVLRTLQGIEKGIDASPHRDADGNYADRAIDIDIIAIDSLMISTPELTLPHPRMHLRDFVLIPLRQLTMDNGQLGC